MLSRLFQLISYLIILAFSCMVMMAGWIVYDGLKDGTQHADVALVPAYSESSNGILSPGLKARLDRAVQLYQQGRFSSIIVSGVMTSYENDEAKAMASYLEADQVPANVIIQDDRGAGADDTVANLIRIMKEQHFRSVIIINTYYRLTRMKLVLGHSGVNYVEYGHVSEFKKEDVLDIAREAFAIYNTLNTWYLLPTEKRAEAQGEQLKDQVSKNLNSAMDSTKGFTKPADGHTGPSEHEANP